MCDFRGKHDNVENNIFQLEQHIVGAIICLIWIAANKLTLCNLKIRKENYTHSNRAIFVCLISPVAVLLLCYMWYGKNKKLQTYPRLNFFSFFSAFSKLNCPFYIRSGELYLSPNRRTIPLSRNVESALNKVMFRFIVWCPVYCVSFIHTHLSTHCNDEPHSINVN